MVNLFLSFISFLGFVCVELVLFFKLFWIIESFLKFQFLWVLLPRLYLFSLIFLLISFLIALFNLNLKFLTLLSHLLSYLDICLNNLNLLSFFFNFLHDDKYLLSLFTSFFIGKVFKSIDIIALGLLVLVIISFFSWFIVWTKIDSIIFWL